MKERREKRDRAFADRKSCCSLENGASGLSGLRGEFCAKVRQPQRERMSSATHRLDLDDILVRSSCVCCFEAQKRDEAISATTLPARRSRLFPPSCSAVSKSAVKL